MSVMKIMFAKGYVCNDRECMNIEYRKDTRRKRARVWVVIAHTKEMGRLRNQQQILEYFVSHFLNDPATDYSSLNVAAVFDDLLTRRSGISASGAVPDTAPGSPAKQAGDAPVHS